MDSAHIFWWGTSRHFAPCLVSFELFCIAFASFCVVLPCVESIGTTSHYIATTFVVFFFYLDDIYVDLLNSCDFFFITKPIIPSSPKFSSISEYICISYMGLSNKYVVPKEGGLCCEVLNEEGGELGAKNV